MNRLVIVGAGGHGKSVADNAIKNGYSDICFVDDNETGECMGYPIIGVFEDIDQLNDGKTDFVIGIGNNKTRSIIAEKYNTNWVALVHPTAVIATNASIGKGTVIMANAVVNVCAKVGEHCIINTGAILEHDNVIENYAHISPNVALGGTVHIGALTQVGIGAVVSNNIKICNDSLIGAGAVVAEDIVQSGIYIGVPARKIR